MKRYRLTKSGVCDCMLPDDNGPWVKHEYAEQAHREGWEQAKAEAVKAVKPEVYPNNKYIVNTIFQCAVAIAEMEYKERTNG